MFFYRFFFVLIALALSASVLFDAASFAQSSLQAIQIQADSQSYDSSTGQSRFLGNVRVAYQGMRIQGKEALISLSNTGQPAAARFLHRPLLYRQGAAGQRDEIRANELQMDFLGNQFNALGDVVSDFKTISDSPVHVESPVQQYNMNKQQMAAVDGVTLSYQDSRIQSEQALMKLSNDGKAERVVFVGQAQMDRPQSHIESERMTVIMANENLIAERNVRTEVLLAQAQGGGSGGSIYLRSDVQQFDQRANSILASGHVKIVYEDYTVTGPKATFRLKPGQGMSVDHILLTGRPTIIDKDRQITADQIVITTEPRKFDARGNVKTKFRSRPGASPAKKTPSAPGTAITPLSPVFAEEDELNVPAPTKEEIPKESSENSQV